MATCFGCSIRFMQDASRQYGGCEVLKTQVGELQSRFSVVMEVKHPQVCDRPYTTWEIECHLSGPAAAV